MKNIQDLIRGLQSGEEVTHTFNAARGSCTYAEAAALKKAMRCMNEHRDSLGEVYLMAKEE